MFEDRGPQQLENMLVVLKYLHQHPCVNCGESDVRVLDFDHKDPKIKNFGIGDAVFRAGLTVDVLEAEIALCDVRCANCHRKKTGSWRAVSVEVLEGILESKIRARNLHIRRPRGGYPGTQPINSQQKHTKRLFWILKWLDKHPPKDCEI